MNTARHAWSCPRTLGGLAAALMAVAALSGLFVPGLYRDNALVTASWRGDDAITLLLAVPLLAVAAWRARTVDRARIVVLGMLLYAFYSYLFYLFGAAFNTLFLVYVAIVTISAFGLVLGATQLDLLHADRTARTPGDRPVAVFMLVVGTVLGVFWVALAIRFVLTGEPPPMVQATAHPTNVTGALDLVIVVPLALVGGIGLLRGRAWAPVLAIVWNIKGAVYMLALSAATVTAFTAGATTDVAQLALWLPIGAGSLAASIALLRTRRPAPA